MQKQFKSHTGSMASVQVLRGLKSEKTSDVKERFRAKTITVRNQDWIEAGKKARGLGINMSALLRLFVRSWLDGDIEIKL